MLWPSTDPRNLSRVRNRIREIDERIRSLRAEINQLDAEKYALQDTSRPDGWTYTGPVGRAQLKEGE